MKPIKVTMQAFGSYSGKTTISFDNLDQNLFLITGDTGAGKTTIFNAIVFALYGEGGASSSSNRTTDDFQSQYAALDVEPFVELVFSDGEDGDIYTVRRVPRHMRFKKRARKGTDDMTWDEGYVELTLPDGTSYPGNKNSTDEKLVEIVGLNKKQFMQVAMIAQGEFMELLSAETKTRKEIFQHLFYTERYAKLVEELYARQKAKNEEYDKAFSECQELVESVRIPDDYAKSEELRILKEDIAAGDLSQLDVFSEELKDLCKNRQKAAAAAGKTREKAQLARDNRLTDYNSAQELIRLYEQLDEAEKTLAECKGREEEINGRKQLIRQIQDAYDIQAAYDKYEEAEKQAAETKDKLQAEREELPDLKEKAQKADEKEQAAQAEADEKNAAYHKRDEQVMQAKTALKLAKEAREQLDKDEESLKKQNRQLKKIEQELGELKEEQEQYQQQKAETEADKEKLTLWTARAQTMEQLKEEASLTKAAADEYQKQVAAVARSQAAYDKAKQKYCEADQAYEQMYQRFLDVQAGVLARELKPGMPCPVCGSLDHPDPCAGLTEEDDLSRETLDAEKDAVDQLRTKQGAAAETAKEEKGICGEKQKTFTRSFQNLCAHMKPAVLDWEGNTAWMRDAGLNLEQMQKEIDRLLGVAAKEKENYEQQEETLKALQQSLDDLKEKEEALTESKAEAEAKQADAKSAWDQSRAVLAEREQACTYPSEDEADQALQADKTRSDQARLAHEKAREEAEQAKTNAHQTEVLISEDEQKIPALQEKADSCLEAYEKIRSEKNMDEAAWKELCREHEKTEADRLQEEVSDFREKQASAEGIRTTALHAVNDRPRPDVEKLRGELTQAEEELAKANEALAQVQADADTDQGVYDRLAESMDARRKVFEEKQRLERLYTTFGGKTADGRMDIETFVQRRYLEQILVAANRRFQKMTGGQYELRMRDIEATTEGWKNKGLDLLVYSYNTGKEREVRTLSGGESFMAALSLALGMADQIQANTAAIHLDILFVDEGFGSLSDDVRKEAIRVLQDMAGGDKLIGIISHVTELKDEIEQQLVVTKDDATGSHARWYN